MKRTAILLISLVYAIVSYTQGEATITFKSEQPTLVEIYLPIDGSHQSRLVSEELDLKPSMPIERKYKVVDFTTIGVKISNRFATLFLFPGDYITLNYTNENEIEITGSNATAHRYYPAKLHTTMRPVDRIWEMLMQADDFEKVVVDIEQTVLKAAKDSLGLLRQNSEVSTELIDLMQKDLSLTLYSNIQLSLSSLYGNRTLSEQEKAATFAEAEKILLKMAPLSPDIMKYPFGNFIVYAYYRLLFHKMDSDERNNLLQGYSSDTFGPHIHFLLAPDHIRMPRLGGILLFQLMNRTTEFNEIKMYEYLKKHYPKSEYVALATKIFESRALHKGNEDDSIHFISQPITTLAEFSNLPELKGKYLLIDLWATWCVPCRQEFRYKHRVKRILETHSNLAIVYISIDEDNRDSQWRADVERFQLYGYHIRAQKGLVEDIKEKVFQSERISVPRYILISPSGELLNTHLPRPSYGNELAESIRKYLK
jgi:thiol-disulfide isomerase/thioredoxin